jgi:mono/diheme cytochrome c family protein
MVPNSLHPKLQFTPDELNGLVAYLETLGEAPAYSAQAANLFQHNCGACHKVNGQGGNIGPDLTSVGNRHDLSFFAPFISNPSSVVTGATMPAFQNKLSQDQINDLAAYLSSLRGGTATPAPSATTAPAPTVTSSGPVDPANLYHTYCEGCHGVNQQGGIGPALTPSALADTSSSDLANTIANGEDQMPGFSNRLSSAQINGLANFLKNPPSSTATAPAAPGASSAPISGAQIFSTYCAGCHGVSRQGGIGPALTAAALSSRSSAQLVTTITSGKGNMPSFSSQLSSAQISAVADYIKSSP